MAELYDRSQKTILLHGRYLGTSHLAGRPMFEMQRIGASALRPRQTLLCDSNIVSSAYDRLLRMRYLSVWPWRSIAHHWGFNLHSIILRGTRGQAPRGDSISGGVGGACSSRGAIRAKHMVRQPLNPLFVACEHGSEWENSAEAPGARGHASSSPLNSPKFCLQSSKHSIMRWSRGELFSGP